MVLFLIKIDSKEDLAESRVSRIGKFMQKYGAVGNDVIFFSISEYESEIDNIVTPLEWSSIGNRSKDEYNLLCNTISEWLSTNFSVFFVSSYEMSLLITNFFELEEKNTYDIVTLSFVENKWSHDAFEFVDDICNSELPLIDNILFIFRSLLIPELAYLSERNRVSKERIKKKCLKLSKNANEIRRAYRKFLKNVKDDNGDDAITKVQDVTRKMITIGKNADENIDKCKEIIDKLKYTENRNIFDSEKLILFPTQFSLNQIELQESLLSDHCYHEFVLKNATPFYWRNLVIYIEITGERLLEISELGPFQTIKPTTDYDFDLITQKGTYEVQVYYGSQAVSKKVTVARILLISLLKVNQIWNISMQNNGVKIEGCQVKITRVKDQNEKTVITTFHNYKNTTILVQDLIVGELYEIQVISKGMVISNKLVERA